MTEITREQIEELRGLLTKATKGPWSTHLVDDTTIISPEREVATTCDSSQTEREDGYNIEYEQMEIDAALIVTMRNALPALLDIAETAIRNLEQAKGGGANAAVESRHGDATSPGVTAGASAGEDGELCKRVDDTLQAMASQAFVPMGLWDKHSNGVLALIARIRSLSSRVEEAERDVAREELDIWRSVFPDIAPESVVPDRSLLESRATAAEAEVERLRAALRPFAKAASDYERQGEFFSNNIELVLRVSVFAAPEYHNSTAVQVGDLRRARTALEGKSDE